MTGAQWITCREQSEWSPVAGRIWREEQTAVDGIASTLTGYCVLCQGRTTFFGLGVPLQYREGIQCVSCRCNARQRAAAAVLLKELPEAASASVYITEQASAVFLALRKRVARLLGSEFTTSWRKRLTLSLWLLRHHRLFRWVRHEDVTALRFGDASLDGVVTLDVLEHVPDYEKALREFVRVLRPGGVLVLTVPFYDGQFENERIASIGADGKIEHVGEPEFHGDPLSGGVLCFHHFGWELLAAMRKAGFSDAAAVRVRDGDQGLPVGLWVLRAVR